MCTTVGQITSMLYFWKFYSNDVNVIVRISPIQCQCFYFRFDATTPATQPLPIESLHISKCQSTIVAYFVNISLNITNIHLSDIVFSDNDFICLMTKLSTMESLSTIDFRSVVNEQINDRYDFRIFANILQEVLPKANTC